MTKKILKQSFLFLLFMLELFTSKFLFLVQGKHKIKALFSFCICFWIQHLFNSILIEKGAQLPPFSIIIELKRCIQKQIKNENKAKLSSLKNVMKTSLQMLRQVISSCKCIIKGLEKPQFLNFHDYAINILTTVFTNKVILRINIFT